VEKSSGSAVLIQTSYRILLTVKKIEWWKEFFSEILSLSAHSLQRKKQRQWELAYRKEKPRLPAKLKRNLKHNSWRSRTSTKKLNIARIPSGQSTQSLCNHLAKHWFSECIFSLVDCCMTLNYKIRQFQELIDNTTKRISLIILSLKESLFMTLSKSFWNNLNSLKSYN